MGVSVEIRGIEEVEDYLGKIPDRSYEDTKKIFRRAVLATHAKVSQRLVSGPLQSRTGLLRKSLQTEVSGKDLGSLRAGVGSAKAVNGQPVVYSAIQELGGEIVAKKAYRNVPGGPYLNIPLDDNKTLAGVMRRTPRQVFDAGGYLVRGKNRWVVMLDGAPMFVLVKKVTIPARLELVKTAEDQVPGILSDLDKLIGRDA